MCTNSRNKRLGRFCYSYVTVFNLGLGDSIADVRALYQAKQAAAKVKKVNYDETKHRDEVDMSNQIRSYPMAASTSPERQVKDLPTSSKSVIKKSQSLFGKGNYICNFSFSFFT
jgi:hypothetical protein